MTNNEKDLSDKSVSQSREIKFRIWNKTVYKKFLDSTIISLNNTWRININSETNGWIDLYTWLKDKNWVEIYELDYVDYKWKTYKVFYNKYKISLANISWKDIIDLTDDILSDLFIIWNLYENRH